MKHNGLTISRSGPHEIAITDTRSETRAELVSLLGAIATELESGYGECVSGGIAITPLPWRIHTDNIRPTSARPWTTGE